jgi:hypothetical protein
MIEMNELLKSISRRLCHISIEDMSKCERLIARDLKDAGYLEEVNENDPSYKLTKKAESK